MSNFCTYIYFFILLEKLEESDDESDEALSEHESDASPIETESDEDSPKKVKSIF